MSSRLPWKKSLYENCGYPDNYTDSSFLKELRKNIHKQDISYREAILSSGRITERLCLVTIFYVIFLYLYDEWLEPQTVFIHTSFGASVCYLLYIWCSKLPCYATVAKDCKTVVTFLVFGYISSPVLKGLTETISTDTIFATTISMMMIHLIFCDYQVPAAIVSHSFSLNAAIFAAICLASRLPTPFHAFVLLTISAELFVLYPVFVQFLISKTFSYLGGLILCTFFLLMSTSVTSSIFFLLLSLFVNLVCPILFVHWQKYKDNIYGPWDEAIVKDNN